MIVPPQAVMLTAHVGDSLRCLIAKSRQAGVTRPALHKIKGSGSVCVVRYWENSTVLICAVLFNFVHNLPLVQNEHRPVPFRSGLGLLQQHRCATACHLITRFCYWHLYTVPVVVVVVEND